MDSVFVDTSYWLALEVQDDQFHPEANRHWMGLGRSLPQLVTTSFVVSETVTMLNRRDVHAKAVEVGNRLLQSKYVDLVHVSERLFLEGWEFLVQHQDKRYSLTDCISFVLMKQRGLTAALTFDKHFRQAGFQTEPRSETP